MDSKFLWKTHLKLHKLAHPFEHIAHGGLIILLLFIIKSLLGIFFMLVFHLSAFILILSFALSTAGSVYAEKNYLKKFKRKL